VALVAMLVARVHKKRCAYVIVVSVFAQDSKEVIPAHNLGRSCRKACEGLREMAIDET
jgi:hypothetical protein